MEEISSAAGCKEPPLIALKDLDGLERVRAAARRRVGEDREGWNNPDVAYWRFREVIEVAGWSAGCVGICDAAAVVRVAREEIERAGVDLSGVDLEDDYAESLAGQAISEEVDEDPPALAHDPFAETVAKLEPLAREWMEEHPERTTRQEHKAVVRFAMWCAEPSDLLGATDYALAALCAFRQAGMDVGDGAALLPAQNAAAAVLRRKTGTRQLRFLERDPEWLASEREEADAWARRDAEWKACVKGSRISSRLEAKRTKSAEVETIAPAPPAPLSAPASPAAPAFCVDVGGEPGVLGDLARWSLSSAFRPVREFAIPSALAVLATVFGRRFVTPTGAGLNLYMVALAGTGVGKEDLLKAPQTILGKAGLGHLLGPGDFTSDSAIEATVRAHPSVFVPMDEFGQFVQAVQGRNAPAFAKLSRKALLELFSKSGLEGRWTGKQKAGDGVDKASEPIYSPTLTLLGCSTIDGFFEGLTEANFTDGFINRLVVVRGGRPGPRNTTHSRLTPPPALIEALKGMCEASTAGQGNLCAAAARHAGTPPNLREVPWADYEAEAAWGEVCDWQDVAEEAGRSGTAARAAENTLKVATIRALAHAPAAPAVTAADVRWAWRFIEASIETVEEGARQNMAGSEFEAAVKAIERAVIAAGPEGITRADLDKTRGISKLPDRMIDEALKRLERGERIVQGVSKIPGKPGRPRLRIISTTFTGTVD